MNKKEEVGKDESNSKINKEVKYSRELMKKRVQVHNGAEAVLQWEDYLVNSSKHTNQCSCAGLDGPCKGCVFLLNPRGPK